MTIARFQSLAHWGAFTALVEDGRLVGCEPFARDPAPSDMLDAMPDMVHSPLRIARPAIREGWREGRPRTGARQLPRSVVGRGARHGRGRARARARERTATRRSSAAPTAGRRPGACTMRARWCGGFCFSAAAASTRSATTASARRISCCRAFIGSLGPVTGRVTDWPSIIKHTRLIIAFGGLATQERPGDARAAAACTRWRPGCARPRRPASSSSR